MSHECQNEQNQGHQCCNKGNSCHDHHQSSSCHQHEHGHEQGEYSFPRQLLDLADAAWMELLKEKMKKHVELACGERLDQLAKLVTEADCAAWEHKMNGKKSCEEYNRRVKELLCQGESCKK